MNFSNFQPIHVLGGQCVVSDDPDAALTTVLGSCVSACIHDPVLGIGGMNHFILPTSASLETAEGTERYGDIAMRTLVDALFDLGAQRWRLRAKLYGGRMRKGESGDVGSANAAFARKFLQSEEIKLVEARLGEDVARWVTFHPTTGRVRLKEISDMAPTIPDIAPRIMRQMR